MALGIENEALNALAEETIPESKFIGPRKHLARQERLRGTSSTEERLKEIARSCSELPVHDSGSDEEIVAYDLNGAPS